MSQAEAVQGLVDLHSDMWWDIAEKLTCTEAEAVYYFLLEFKGGAVADEFMRSHAHGDCDETDQHKVDETNTCGWSYNEEEA